MTFKPHNMSKQNKLSSKIKGWVARNKEDNALIFVPGDEPPTRMSTYWFTGFAWGYTNIDDVFPDLKWEDEPLECEMTIKVLNSTSEHNKTNKEKPKKEKPKKDETPEEGTPEYAKLVEEAWKKLSPEEQELLANCHCEYGAMVDEYEENFHPGTEYPEF